MDTSGVAIQLARDNIEHNIRLGHLKPIAQHQIEFVQDDIFDNTDEAWPKSSWDIVVANPPYISPNAFNTTTARSVRNYEPKPALVPSRSRMSNGKLSDDHAIGDMFYPRLLRIAHNVDARVLLMEVADMPQATRVATMALTDGVWSGCEIWRDWHMEGTCSGKETACISGHRIHVRGHGNGRAVLVWKKNGGT